MAEYLIEDTTLTSLGNSIRGLNDTTATLTPAQMKSTVDDAVSEVEEQTDLIAQCLSALEGKVGGSGGSAVETCTVTVNFAGNADGYPSATGVKIIYQTIVSGKPQVSRLETLQNTTSIDNVLVGTLFCIVLEDFLDITGFNMTVQSLTLVDSYIDTGEGLMFSVDDSQASITFS